MTDNAQRVLAKFGKRETFTAGQIAQRQLAGVEFISKKFAEYGITGVCYDSGRDSIISAMQIVRQRGNLHTRINYEGSDENPGRHDQDRRPHRFWR